MLFIWRTDIVKPLQILQAELQQSSKLSAHLKKPGEDQNGPRDFMRPFETRQSSNSSSFHLIAGPNHKRLKHIDLFKSDLNIVLLNSMLTEVIHNMDTMPLAFTSDCYVLGDSNKDLEGLIQYCNASVLSKYQQ